MTDGKRFIVRLDDQNFFTRLSEGEVRGSEYPSYATCFEYGVADEISRRLRNRGYLAFVCTLSGDPVTIATLKAAPLPASESMFLEYWDDRPTKEERELARETIANKDPKDLAVRLGIDATELQTRMSDAVRRFGGSWMTQEQIDGQ